MSNLNVIINKSGDHSDIAVVQIYGPLDTIAAYTFQEKMNTLISTGVYKYIIDLKNLEYISSAGIGVFPGMVLELQKHNGGVVFVHVSEKIHKLFDMIGLMAIFEIKDTLEEAIKEFEPDEQ
jgi:anti-sigma B factor antagonist